MDESQRPHMNNRYRLSFFIMIVFLIEILGLIQAIYSVETIKFELERKIEMDAVQLLHQFRSAYDMTEDIQGLLGQFSEKQVDEAMVRSYKQIENGLQVVPLTQRVVTYSADSFRVMVRVNDNTAVSMLKQRYDTTLEELKPYKLLTYETKQDGVVTKSSRTLLGVTRDKKYLLEIEFDESESAIELQKSQRELNDILSRAYYFNEKSGNFYIFSESGRVLYQGGYEKNADYFQQLDLNSNTKLFDLLKANPQIAIRVIYDAGGEAKRSLLYAEQEVGTGAYFVYELNLKERFAYIDGVYRFIWLLGVGVLLVTFIVVWVIWNKSKTLQPYN